MGEDDAIQRRMADEMAAFDEMVRLCPRLKNLILNGPRGIGAAAQMEMLMLMVMEGRLFSIEQGLEEVADSIQDEIRRWPPLVRRDLTRPRRRGTL